MTVNKMRRLVIGLSVVVLIFGAVSIADSTLVDFVIGDENRIDVLTSGLDIGYDLDGSLYGYSFSLNEGDSETFDYAVVNSISVITDADSYDIVAYLDFDLPPVGPVGSGGVTTIEIEGTCKMSTTEVSIDFDPVTVGFGDSGQFIVELSDVYALWNGGGCCSTPTSWAETITATVTLESTPIPEPSTLLLLGSGLLGVTAFRMRRGRKS